MSHNHPAEAWTTHSSKWASSVQEISRAPGRELLSMSTSLVTHKASSTFLDNGAGSGMFTSVILDKYPDAIVTAADVSSGMIDTFKKSWGPLPNVTALVADACDLGAAGLKDESFTYSIGTFFLNFVPDPSKAITEMMRVTEANGVVAVSTWSRVSWVPLWEAAVRETIDPNYIAPPLFHQATTEAGDVQRMFETAGLRNITVKSFNCPHPRKESVQAVTDEFMNMGNPSVQLLHKGFTEEQITQTRPAFARAYAQKYDGINKTQEEVAILAVGQR